MRKYSVIDFIVMVVCLILVIPLTFEAVYVLFHNQLSDGLHCLIVTVTCAINAYIISENLKNELK